MTTKRITRLGGALVLALTSLAAGMQSASAQDKNVNPPSAKALERVRAFERDVQAAFKRVSPAYIVVSGGSGVVISADGWALTNHHVVAGRKIGDRFWTRRPGGEAVETKIIAWDARGDIALLKLKSDKPLPFAPLGDSDSLIVGDLVLALGNPYGFAWDGHPTRTLGIVSAVHSYQDAYSDAIQTDAPINPGNSGGPLLNLRGEVVGINGRVAVRFGNRMNTGVGYAIPANQIKRFLPHFKKGGSIQHGRITGLYVSETKEGGDGALVTRVSKGSAIRAGLKKGDIVIEAGGREITNAASLYSVVGTYVGGQSVDLVVLRKGKRIKLDAQLIAYPPQNADERSGAWLGISLGGASESSPQGAFIERVEPKSPAERAGLQAKDLIVAIGGTQVGSTEELIAIIQSHQPGDEIDIDVLRDKSQITLTAKLGDWRDRGK
jgi:serine protease Do